uniref:Uroplakin 3B n=1 Tax=Varanus komodoensis TaxID=61221 RepID=A0A8D2KRS0_VARKO
PSSTSLMKRLNRIGPGGPQVISYTPRVSELPMEGKVTGSTFALEPPNCIFDPFANSSDSIWLVVTFINGESAVRPPALQGPALRRVWLSTEGNVLRVGNESSCKNDDSRTHCNGPLPSPGPFRVKFLVIDSSGSKAETRWSGPITLNKGTLVEVKRERWADIRMEVQLLGWRTERSISGIIFSFQAISLFCRLRKPTLTWCLVCWTTTPITPNGKCCPDCHGGLGQCIQGLRLTKGVLKSLVFLLSLCS